MRPVKAILSVAVTLLLFVAWSGTARVVAQPASIAALLQQSSPLPDPRFKFFSNLGLTITKANGTYSTNYNPLNFKPTITGTTVYVDNNPLNCNNANPGTDPAFPRCTISGTGATANLVYEYKIKGNSLTPYRVTNQNFVRSIAISSWDGGRVVIALVVNVTPETWTATVGHSGVYQTAFATSPYNVVDLNFTETWGTPDAPAYRVLTNVAFGSIDTPGTWNWDGTNVYVHTTDGRMPDAQVLATNATGNVNFVSSSVESYPIFWVDQVDAVGGFDSFTVTQQTSAGGDGGNNNFMAFINRSTGQAGKDQGMHFVTVGTTVQYLCGGYANLDDGFHFDSLNTTSLTDPSGNHVLINPYAYNNGASPSTQANSYSQHSLSNAVVINPKFGNAWNRDVHNISSSYMWMLGGSIGPSRQATGVTSISLQAGNVSGDTARIWVDGTTINAGSQYDLNVSGIAGAILFKRGNPGYSINPISVGVVGTYNFLLKRDIDPASNDNDPMWLNKAA